jgi:hypothetical protein
VFENFIRAGTIDRSVACRYVVRRTVIDPETLKIVPTSNRNFLGELPGSRMSDKIELRETLDIARDDLSDTETPKRQRDGKIPARSDLQNSRRNRPRMPNGIVHDTLGDDCQRVQCRGRTRPISGDAPLQEIMQLRAAGNFQRTKCQCLEPPVHSLNLDWQHLARNHGSGFSTLLAILLGLIGRDAVSGEGAQNRPAPQRFSA